MSNPAQLVADILPTFSDHAVAEALSVLQRGRPNMLLVGAEEAVDRLLERIHLHLDAPIASWMPRRRLTWPGGDFQTLIVRGVDGLSPTQQTQLTALDRPVHIVSTTAEPLYPAVKSGAFAEALYYRLNVVVISSLL